MRYTEHDDHGLGEAPIESGYRVRMGMLARHLNRTLNKKGTKATGFILMVFPHGHVGRCNYVSNGVDRSDVAKLLLEQAAAFLQDEGHLNKAERIKQIRAEFEAEGPK